MPTQIKLEQGVGGEHHPSAADGVSSIHNVQSDEE